MLRSTSLQFTRITREQFEDSFHADFNDVRVHFDERPTRYGALALASGNKVVLLPQLADLGATALLPILAHELTHVVQQRGLKSATGVLRNRELESEALEWEGRFAGLRLAKLRGLSPLFEPSQASARCGAVIQCASAAFTTLSTPGATTVGGLQYFNTPKLKESFREAIENYVRLVRPGDVGVNTWDGPGDARKKYVKALLARFERTPYLLKELVGDKKVAYDDLPPADKRWVMDELYRAWDTIRKDKQMFITTRLCLNHTPSWLDFRTQDCVFAAILHTLIDIKTKRVDPSKVKGRSSDDVILESETEEAAMEAWLADHFGVARAITPDVQIIHLLESELGWKNMSEIKTFRDLKSGAYKGKSYIVSYEKTPGTQEKDAFWHTVYVDIGSNGTPTVTDRQATGMGSSGAIAETAKCDAWLINTETTGYKDLKKAFNSRI